MPVSPRLWTSAAIVAALALPLGACGGNPDTVRETKSGPSNDRNSRDMVQGLGGRNREEGSIFGPGGIFGTKSDKKEDTGLGVAVNAYLWRASLDTINFIPLASADPFGGVIITDWYSDPTTPTERFKASVYILDTRLRADALNVSIFRQTQVNGQWTDASVDPDTEIQIENAILTRARQLRLSTLGN